MSKIVILGIIVMMLGIIVLPETMSLFENQHTFYNLSSNQGVPCMKCHNDIQSQFMTGVNTPHSEFKCNDCHKINMIESGSHSATIPMCISCHNGNMTPNQKIDPHKVGNSNNCVKCHDDAGFKTGLNIQNEINNLNEPHKKFLDSASNNSLMSGSNEACIGCHTNIQVNITWNKVTTMIFEVTTNNTVINFNKE